MIQAYPEQTSIFPGDTLILHVSTNAPQFRIDFYRQGATLDFKLSSDWFQGIFADDHDWDQDWGIAATRRDGKHVDAWPPYSLSIPHDWQTGVYIAMLVEGNGQGNPNPNQDPPLDNSTADARTSKAMFVVKNPAPGLVAPILYKLPLFTYQAYNRQGGNSLYQLAEGEPITIHRPGGGTGGTPWDASTIDVFDPGTPRQTFAHWDAKFISWLEDPNQGYRVDYCTDLDIHNDDKLELLSPYSLVLSVGHDEYYSEKMRNNLEAYIAKGGNMAFFSGNVCWWRVVFQENDPLRFSRINHWSDKPDPDHPENSLTGVSYRNGGGWWDDQRDPVGYIVQNSRHWAYEKTGQLKRFGENEHLVGYECDGAEFAGFDCNTMTGIATPTGNDKTPPGFLILGIGCLHPGWEDFNGNHTATMGLYTNSGTVFNAATTDWARVLKGGEPTVIQITRNVLDRLGGNPKGLAPLRNIQKIICCDGFFSTDDNFRHALVGTADGYITEISFSPVSGQPQGVNAFQNGLLDLSGFTSDDDQLRHIVAVTSDGNVWAMPYSINQLHPPQIILTNIPNAIRVCGFYTSDDNFRHAIVATSDGSVLEVYYRGIGNNANQAPLGKFNNIVDVAGFFSHDDNYRHAIVGTADGNVTEIYFNPDVGISQTVIANVPGLAKVSAYYAANDNFFNRRVQVLTKSGRIYEIRYNPNFGIMRAVLFNTNDLIDIGGFFSGDDNFRHAIIAKVGGDVQELFYNP